MCLILFAHRAHPEYPLVLGANRDEFYDRPTAPAAPWPEAPDLLAGRDLRGGGTWLGVTRAGRWAAVTNFRDPAEIRPDAPSRGRVVADYLLGSLPPDEYLSHLRPRAREFNGFNLLVADKSSVWWLSNRAPGPVEVEPGVHGLSNALLDTPWPKVERGTRELERSLSAADAIGPDRLLELLLDRTVAADRDLPSTGVARDLERALSAAFIVTPDYGTRSSTALLVHRDGRIEWVERTYERGAREPVRIQRFTLEPHA